MIKEHIDTYVDEKLDKIIQEIFTLVRYPSVSDNKEENRACLSYVLSYAEKMGFKTMTTSNWDVGIVEMGEGDETLGILVHVDVVGIGDIEKWTDDPFAGVLRDGYLWGRGTEDDKGGVMMSLYAMKAVKELGLPMHRKVWLIIGTTEEIKWTDIASFKSEFPVPDFGFSPDGRFPIFNIEKGYADVILDFFSDGKKGIQKIRAGDSANTIPSKARIVLADGQSIVVHGKAQHSSLPKDGDNAILKLCKKLEKTEGVDFDFVKFVRKYLCHDGLTELAIDDDNVTTYEGEYIGRTTVVPTILRLMENHVRLNINIRHKYGTTREDILNAFLTHEETYGYKVSIPEYLEPMWVSKELPFLKIVVEVSEEYGMDSGFRFAPGTSYAKSMKNFISWGPLFPEDPSTAHIENECLSVEAVSLGTKLYARLISRMTVEA
jgi:succinyl-diaminopimelate desuccinylase